AADRDVIVRQVTKGEQIPTFSFVPPGTANFAAWTPDEAKLTQAQRDAKAKELFAKAGYGKDKPLSVEFVYNTQEAHKKVAIAVAAMWKQKLG
ncbi:ABC transporter substrate-binding protein, partial [Acinetobacter baumannii]